MENKDKTENTPTAEQIRLERQARVDEAEARYHAACWELVEARRIYSTILWDMDENEPLNNQGHVFYPEKEIQIVVACLETSDGCTDWRGIRVGNWAVHEGFAVRVDENGSSETISIKDILVAHDINLDWSTWDDNTIKLLETELPK